MMDKNLKYENFITIIHGCERGDVPGADADLINGYEETDTSLEMRIRYNTIVEALRLAASKMLESNRINFSEEEADEIQNLTKVKPNLSKDDLYTIVDRLENFRMKL